MRPSVCLSVCLSKRLYSTNINSQLLFHFFFNLFYHISQKIASNYVFTQKKYFDNFSNLFILFTFCSQLRFFDLKEKIRPRVESDYFSFFKAIPYKILIKMPYRERLYLYTPLRHNEKIFSLNRKRTFVF